MQGGGNSQDYDPEHDRYVEPQGGESDDARKKNRKEVMEGKKKKKIPKPLGTVYRTRASEASTSKYKDKTNNSKDAIGGLQQKNKRENPATKKNTIKPVKNAGAVGGSPQMNPEASGSISSGYAVGSQSEEISVTGDMEVEPQDSQMRTDLMGVSNVATATSLPLSAGTGELTASSGMSSARILQSLVEQAPLGRGSTSATGSAFDVQQMLTGKTSKEGIEVQQPETQLNMTLEKDPPGLLHGSYRESSCEDDDDDTDIEVVDLVRLSGDKTPTRLDWRKATDANDSISLPPNIWYEPSKRNDEDEWMAETKAVSNEDPEQGHSVQESVAIESSGIMLTQGVSSSVNVSGQGELFTKEKQSNPQREAVEHENETVARGNEQANTTPPQLPFRFQRDSRSAAEDARPGGDIANAPQARVHSLPPSRPLDSQVDLNRGVILKGPKRLRDDVSARQIVLNRAYLMGNLPKPIKILGVNEDESGPTRRMKEPLLDPWGEGLMESQSITYPQELDVGSSSPTVRFSLRRDQGEISNSSLAATTKGKGKQPEDPGLGKSVEHSASQSIRELSQMDAPAAESHSNNTSEYPTEIMEKMKEVIGKHPELATFMRMPGDWSHNNPLASNNVINTLATNRRIQSLPSHLQEVERISNSANSTSLSIEVENPISEGQEINQTRGSLPITTTVSTPIQPPVLVPAPTLAEGSTNLPATPAATSVLPNDESTVDPLHEQPGNTLRARPGPEWRSTPFRTPRSTTNQQTQPVQSTSSGEVRQEENVLTNRGQDSGGDHMNAQNAGNTNDDEESFPEDYVADSRARRNQGLRRKGERSAKRQTQKERLQELNGKLPEGYESMKSIVQRHAKLLLGVQGSDLTALPAGPTDEERSSAVQRSRSLTFEQPPATAPASSGHTTKPYLSWIQTRIRELGLTRFTFDWDSPYRHGFNQLMDMLFYRTLDMALHSGEYNYIPWSPDHATHSVISNLLERYYAHMQSQWKLVQRDGAAALEGQRARGRAYKNRDRLCKRRQQWCDESGFPELAAQFNDPGVCSDTEEIELNGQLRHRKKLLDWRSPKFSILCSYIDRQIATGARIGRGRNRQRVIIREDGDTFEASPRVPERLSRQVYNEEWLSGLTEGTREALKMRDVVVMTEDGLPYSG